MTFSSTTASALGLGGVGDNLLAVLVVANTRRGSAVAATLDGTDTIDEGSAFKFETYLCSFRLVLSTSSPEQVLQE